MARATAGHETGFSLQEVLVVAALGLIITVVGLPTMANAIANMKLWASMTSVGAFIQYFKDDRIAVAGGQRFPSAQPVALSAGFGTGQSGTD